MTTLTSAFSWEFTAKALFFLSFSALNALATLPERPAFRRYSEPRFPVPLLSTTVTRGDATVAYLVGANGRIEEALTVSASHPSFGQAVVDAMNSWEVEPTAAVPGRRESIQFLFVREHAITSLNQRESAKSFFSPSQDDAHAVRTVSWASLALPPKRITFVPPEYPEEVRSRHVQGSASVSFFIDEEGVVRIPTVTKADEASFGRELLKAVRQWRFTPPTSEGRPVIVQVEREFSFVVR